MFDITSPPPHRASSIRSPRQTKRACPPVTYLVLLCATLFWSVGASAQTTTDAQAADNAAPSIASAPEAPTTAEDAPQRDAAPQAGADRERGSHHPADEAIDAPNLDEPPPLSDAELEALTRAFEADQDQKSEDAAGATAGATAAPDRRVGAAIMSTLNPEMALILDVAFSYFSDTAMQLGAHDPHRTGFTFQQLEMSFAANVDPYFLFRANLVFAEFGVEIEEAYAQTTSLPGRLQLRAGQFLSRFGRINSTHPHSWQFLDQPLVNGRFFGGEGQRGVGAEISWLAPTSWYSEFIGSVMHGEGECCARSFDGGGELEIGGVQDFLYMLAWKNHFAFDASWSLAWGVSALLGPNATGYNNRSEVYGTDLYLRYRPVTSTRGDAFSLQVEVMHRRRQVPDDLRVDTGMYAQSIWRINRRWEAGARYEWVSGSPGDDLDPEWSSARHRASLQGTYYPSHFSRIRLQANYDNPTWRPRPIWSAMLGLEFVVGAHGSHDF